MGIDYYLSKKNNKKVDSIELLKQGDQKDYISIIDEISKGVDSGAYDFVAGVKEILFASTDYVFDTNFLEAFDEMMKDPEKQPDGPETWRGDLVALMTQFAIPGGVIQKVLRGTKTVGQINKIIKGIKGAKTQKISKIAARAIEGATVVGAVDFIASEPGRKSFFFEPESTEGLTGRERAAASFRNKIKYGQEGALVGFGFPLLGKGAQLGYKYGLAPFIKTTARFGAKGVNTAVFRPVSYLASRPAVEPVVGGAARLIRNTSDFALTKALAPAIVSAFSGKNMFKKVNQLPPFESGD